MRFEYTMATSAFSWVTAVFAVGLAGTATSVSSWTVLVGAAAVSSLVMMHYWHRPRQPMTQAIPEVVR